MGGATDPPRGSRPSAEPWLLRTAVLAISAVAGSTLCGLLALTQGDVSELRAALMAVRVPAIMVIWLPYVALGALVGYVAGERILRGVRLGRALPLLVAASALATIATGPAVYLLGLPAGLGAGVLAMMGCRLLAERFPSWSSSHCLRQSPPA